VQQDSPGVDDAGGQRVASRVFGASCTGGTVRVHIEFRRIAIRLGLGDERGVRAGWRLRDVLELLRRSPLRVCPLCEERGATGVQAAEQREVPRRSLRPQSGGLSGWQVRRDVGLGAVKPGERGR
jgi:hypothetical protein